MTPIIYTLQTNSVVIFVERSYFHDTIWAKSMVSGSSTLRRRRFHIDDSSNADRYLNDYYTKLVLAESKFGIITAHLPLMIPLSLIAEWGEEALDTALMG